MRAITGTCTDGTEAWSIELRTDELDVDMVAQTVATMFVATKSPHKDWSQWRVELFDSVEGELYSAPFPRKIVERGEELRGRAHQRSWVCAARAGVAGQLH